MRKVLVANRGEIAVRIIRACRDLQLATVAVYSECDRTSRHVRMADEAVAIGKSPAAESYLRIDAIIDAARRARADAIHPGYGFLSENDDFARACRDAGITFIGPSPEAIALMGSKTAARQVATKAGVPLVPGTQQPISADVPVEAIANQAAAVGFPLLIKAVAGGGGKGMRAVATAAELPEAVRVARSEARSAFGDDAVYLERRLTRPRHIEVQLLADAYGTIAPFVERECSIQRRHQKVIEETPSPVVGPELRTALARAAASIAAAASYTNAGTIEFLVDGDGRFYFLEMNTRLQVEHPITEAVTGVDLVRWQFRLARGERLDLDPEAALNARGHAIECRIYAEDPDQGFVPSPGRITSLRVPAGPGVRDDGGAETGTEIPIFYDPLVSKLVAWGADRPEAISRMRRALEEYDVRGIRTTVPFFRWMLAHPDFVSASFHTEYLDEVLQQPGRARFDSGDSSLGEVAALAMALQRSFGPGADQRPSSGRAGTPRAVERPAFSSVGTGGSRWQAAARAESLRS